MLTLRIVLAKCPQGVVFALQKGRGGTYECVQQQESKANPLTFAFEVGVKPGPDFNGPFVQGTAGGRFVYIDIGTYAGQMDSVWSRRMKIPLSGISSAMVESGKVLETRIPGTGKDGGPTCASVKSVIWK